MEHVDNASKRSTIVNHRYNGRRVNCLRKDHLLRTSINYLKYTKMSSESQ